MNHAASSRLPHARSDILFGGLLLILLLGTACTTTHPHSATATVQRAGVIFHYPASWKPTTPPRTDPTVEFAAIGPRPRPDQPPTQYVVRATRQKTDADLTRSIALYEQISRLAHPTQQFAAPQATDIPGAKRAVLITSSYHVNGALAAPPVATVDLFVESTSHRPVHLFASGPPSLITQTFIDQLVLSVRMTS